MKILSLIVLGLSLSLPSSFASELRFRIIAPTYPSFDYNLQKNIFKPDRKERAVELIRKAILEASMLSVVPLFSQIQDNITSLGLKNVQDLKSQKGNMLDLAKATLGQASKSLQRQLEKLKKEHPQLMNELKDPVIQDFYLTPWKQRSGMGFYKSHKISMTRVEQIENINLRANNKAFDQKLDQYLQQYRKESLRDDARPPVYLLSLRNFVFVNIHGQSNIALRALVGLKPNPNVSPDFENKNDQVVLNKVVLPPTNNDEDIVAELLFFLPINSQNKPTLHIKFGEFKRFGGGVYSIESNSKNVPQLTGHTAFTSLIPLEFNFTEVSVDLLKGQVDSLSTLVSPGIQILGKKFILPFGLSIQKVDSQFKNEINATIKAETEKIMQKLFSFGGK